MSWRILALAVMTGCASGSAPNAATDGASGQDAAPLIDAPPQVDAAPPIDGMVDATPPADAPMIDAPVTTPDACVPTVTELLLNKSFDLAPLATMWTEVRYNAGDALVVDQVAAGFNAQSPTQYGWMGGYEAPIFETASDYLYQSVTIPPMTTVLQLTGYYAVGSSDSTTTAYDFGYAGFLFPASPTTPGIIALQLDNRSTANIWTPFSYTVAQNLSGQTIRFQLESDSDDSYPSSFTFDTLSLRATHGCP